MATVLCVEDEEDIREDIADELRDAGYDVVEACNGADGLRMVIDHRPDMVVSDITMPEMDGLTLLTTLREQHPDLVDLPFIFLSALSDREDQMRGKELGVDDYLTKPIDFDMLLVTVKSRLLRAESLRKQKEAEFVKLYQSLLASTNTSEEVDVVDPDTDEDKVESLRTITLSNSKFFVIDLTELRRQLGDRWKRYSDMVDQISVRIIRRHLGTDDIFRRQSVGEYRMSFPALENEAAESRATMIHDEIIERLMGSESVAH